jgi:hypothetical protein
MNMRVELKRLTYGTQEITQAALAAAHRDLVDGKLPVSVLDAIRLQLMLISLTAFRLCMPNDGV